MAESPMVGAKVPQDWQQQIQEIAAAAGRKEAEVVREAIGQYLGQTDPASVKGAIAFSTSTFAGLITRQSLSLGLGLHMCRQLITAHGDEIRAVSSLGKGSTFWFTLLI